MKKRYPNLNFKKIMAKVFFKGNRPNWVVPFCFFAISCGGNGNPLAIKISADSSFSADKASGTFMAKFDALPKDDLTKLYVRAISDYIKASNIEYKIRYDTLFFGKHVFGQADDFPDIQLPKTVENTQIRLISPEIGAKMQQERKSRFYINLFCWATPENAQFFFVTFSNGFEHQFDCYIDYVFNVETKAFEQTGLRFENFLMKKG